MCIPMLCTSSAGKRGVAGDGPSLELEAEPGRALSGGASAPLGGATLELATGGADGGGSAGGVAAAQPDTRRIETRRMANSGIANRARSNPIKWPVSFRGALWQLQHGEGQSP